MSCRLGQTYVQKITYWNIIMACDLWRWISSAYGNPVLIMIQWAHVSGPPLIVSYVPHSCRQEQLLRRAAWKQWKAVLASHRSDLPLMTRRTKTPTRYQYRRAGDETWHCHLPIACPMTLTIPFEPKLPSVLPRLHAYGQFRLWFSLGFVPMPNVQTPFCETHVPNARV